MSPTSPELLLFVPSNSISFPVTYFSFLKKKVLFPLKLQLPSYLLTFPYENLPPSPVWIRLTPTPSNPLQVYLYLQPMFVGVRYNSDCSNYQISEKYGDLWVRCKKSPERTQEIFPYSYLHKLMRERNVLFQEIPRNLRPLRRPSTFQLNLEFIERYIPKVATCIYLHREPQKIRTCRIQKINFSVRR